MDKTKITAIHQPLKDVSCYSIVRSRGDGDDDDDDDDVPLSHYASMEHEDAFLPKRYEYIDKDLMIALWHRDTPKLLILRSCGESQ